MDVFLMIFGFFIVFLILFICFMTVFAGSKNDKPTSNTDMTSSSFEFERILKEKEKENRTKKTSFEDRIEKMNRAELKANSKIVKNQNNLKSEKERIKDTEPIPSRDEKQLTLQDEIKKRNMDFIGNREEKSTPKKKSSTQKNGKIQGHRSSRSLVTVEKTQDDLIFQTIEKMENNGMTIQEIAKNLGRGVREVEMIKRLNEKS